MSFKTFFFLNQVSIQFRDLPDLELYYHKQCNQFEFQLSKRMIISKFHKSMFDYI